MLFQASKSPGLSVFRRGGLNHQQTAATKTPDGKLRASDIRVACSAMVVVIAFILTFIEYNKYSTFSAGLSRVFLIFLFFNIFLRYC